MIAFHGYSTSAVPMTVANRSSWGHHPSYDYTLIYPETAVRATSQQWDVYVDGWDFLVRTDR